MLILLTSFSVHIAPEPSPGSAPWPVISWPTRDRNHSNVPDVLSLSPLSQTVSAISSGSMVSTWWTHCLDKLWTAPTSVTCVSSAPSQLKVFTFDFQFKEKKFLLEFSVNEKTHLLCCDLTVLNILITGNLLKHYKERHVGCELPDTLADLDRAVTKGLSTTIPPHERGMYSVESYNRDNQLNKQDEITLLNTSKVNWPKNCFVGSMRH